MLVIEMNVKNQKDIKNKQWDLMPTIKKTKEEMMANNSYSQIIIGDMRFNTIKHAVKYFRLATSALIEKGLREGTFRGMECRYANPALQKRKQYHGIELRVNKPARGYRVKCENTGEVFDSIAALYRLAESTDSIQGLTYVQFVQRLVKNKTITIENEKYSLLPYIPKKAEKEVVRGYTLPEASTEDIPMQPQIITRKETVEVPVLSHPTNPKELCIKQLLIDMVKDRMMKHIAADEYSDAKGMLEVIEWINNK